MPHAIVKMFPGRDEKTRQELAVKIEQAMIDVLGCTSDSISVAIEEINKDAWKQVYQADIEDKKDTIYKHPGYKLEDL